MNDRWKLTGDWAQGKLVTRFRELIDRLLGHIQKESLPSFFMPGLNLFEDKPNIKSAKTGIDLFLKMLKSNPQDLMRDNLYNGAVTP